MNEKANLTILVTSHCTLKCKLCATYASTNPNPCHYAYEDMVKGVERFFDCMGEVRLFTMSGGEPLMHPRLLDLIKEFGKYTSMMEKFEIITNGTIVPKKEILEVLSKTEKVDIMIDDYGPQLSKNVEGLIVAFEEYGIKYRRRKYYGEDAHLGGWLDISDFSDKKRTEEENEALFHKCMYSNVFKNHYFLINGAMYMCYVNHKLLPGIMEESDERVDILEDTLTNAEIKEGLLNLRKKNHLSVCAYCNGFCNDGERFAPAEQIS